MSELVRDYASIGLVVIIGLVVGLSLINRIVTRKGIGWQFIRFNVIGIGLPLAGLLQLNNLLSEAAAAIIAGAIGYAFGKSGNDD